MIDYNLPRTSHMIKIVGFQYNFDFYTKTYGFYFGALRRYPSVWFMILENMCKIPWLVTKPYKFGFLKIYTFVRFSVSLLYTFSLPHKNHPVRTPGLSLPTIPFLNCIVVQMDSFVWSDCPLYCMLKNYF